jgi:hypothetical protein
VGDGRRTRARADRRWAGILVGVGDGERRRSPSPTLPGVVGEMETLTERMRRLDADGWTTQFEVVDGQVECVRCVDRAAPGDFVVDHVYRFEGPSDPADEAILFALTSPCGHRGTLVTGYGPDVSEETARVVAQLDV